MMPMSAPSPANRDAMAFPIPWPPPVTMATRPSRTMFPTLRSELRRQVDEVLGHDVDRKIGSLRLAGAPFLGAAHEGGPHSLLGRRRQVIRMGRHHHCLIG